VVGSCSPAAAGRSVPPEQAPGARGVTGLAVEVRRSQRRRRTVSAYRDGERVVVLIPARFSRAEESEWVDRMLARLAARAARNRRSDSDLLMRARRLAER